MCNLINTHTHTHTHTPWKDQCEWHRMTRMTGPDCAVMCNLINTHTHTHIQNGEEDTPMPGYTDARRLGERYAERTESIPLK